MLSLVGNLLPISRVNGAEGPADPYGVLYDVIMTRLGPDGKAYGQEEASPTILRSSIFPFGDKTYKKLQEALDAFAAFPQKRIESYSPIRRALMQRYLWHVFAATAPSIKTGTQQRGIVQHFPAGTQSAFIEQAFLISDRGEIILSPL